MNTQHKYFPFFCDHFWYQDDLITLNCMIILYHSIQILNGNVELQGLCLVVLQKRRSGDYLETHYAYYPLQIAGQIRIPKKVDIVVIWEDL